MGLESIGRMKTELVPPFSIMYQTGTGVQISSFNNTKRQSFSQKKKKIPQPLFVSWSSCFSCSTCTRCILELLKYTCSVINSINGNRSHLECRQPSWQRGQRLVISPRGYIRRKQFLIWQIVKLLQSLLRFPLIMLCPQGQKLLAAQHHIQKQKLVNKC